MRRLLVVGLVTGLGLLAGCGRSSQAAPEAGKSQGPAAVVVTVQAARGQKVQRSVQVVGELAGYERPTISNRIAGLVEKIHVDVGARVQPGAKLLEIEPRRFALAVQQAEQQFAEILARLGFSKLASDDQIKIEETAPVRKALSEVEAARIKYDRAKPLHEQKLMRDFEFTDYHNAVRVTESSLQSAREAAFSLVAQARALQALIELKKKDLAETVIYAPDGKAADGRQLDSYSVIARHTSTGEYLREGTQLFTLVADRVLKLQARVPERYLTQVRRENIVRFSVEARPGQKFEGRISTINPAVDPANRTFLIEATVENKDGLLSPGSFVQGEVLTHEEPDVLMVPVVAISSFVGENKVYLIENHKARAVSVELGQQAGEWLEVLKDRGGKLPLKAGDVVAVSGVTKLTEGAAVKVRSEASPEAKP